MEFLMGDFYVFFHVIHASCKVALIIITFKGNSGEPIRLKYLYQVSQLINGSAKFCAQVFLILNDFLLTKACYLKTRFLLLFRT